MMTPEQDSKMLVMLRSGQARFWQRLSGLTVGQVGERIGVCGSTVSDYVYSERRLPADPEVRERFYELLCEWRTEFAGITIAKSRTGG